MRKLFNKYNRHLTYEINKPKSWIIEYISHRKKQKKSFYDRFSGIPLDFSELSIKEGATMEITVQPTTFSPFSGNGRIVISLTSRLDKIGTKMKAEIIPYFNMNVYGIYFLICFLAFLSVIGLLQSISWQTFTAILFFWSILIVIFHLSIIWSRSQLTEKMELLVNELKRKAAANQV